MIARILKLFAALSTFLHDYFNSLTKLFSDSI